MDTSSQTERIEAQVARWRTYLARRGAVRSIDVDELEDHLRSQMTALGEAGLSGDEAFLVAVTRMGALDSLAQEFAREHSDRLWKQLVLGAGSGDGRGPVVSTDLVVVVTLGVMSALAFKLPELFGRSLFDESEAWIPLHFRNLSLFVFPFVALYFAWKRRLDGRTGGWIGLGFVAALLFANIYPFAPTSATQALTALHLPIAAWLIVGLAYTGGRWRDLDARMNFVRFSGELFIYYVLMALGGAVLTGFTAFMFVAIGLDVEQLVSQWLLPSGAMGAVLVGAWLVEAKQSVVENMAPVLTRVFTPLFTIVLLAFLGTMAWTGSGIDVERDVLIGFDLLLVLVLGLLLYAVSARDPQAPPDAFDRLQLVLVVAALIVDTVALAAITMRISEFGFSPNKVAALGENLILAVNLGWSVWLYARFIRSQGRFSDLERWQTTYLPVYGLWAGVVVVVFPPLFGYA